jgi:hypothetical protein
MIVLFTDFGADDIYVGQVKAVLLQHAPNVPLNDLLHGAPSFDPRHAAHLLVALQAQYPRGSVFLAVVDPGVGSEREAAVVHAGGKWFVGPDNGLLSVVAGRAEAPRTWRITWQPKVLAASFHGRDLFAPVVAWIAGGSFPADKLEPTAGLAVRLDVDDLGEVIYIDHYGNAMTGLRAFRVPHAATLAAGGGEFRYARVFSEVAPGEAFWYENSIGLAEIAVNRGSAASRFGLRVGEPVRMSWRAPLGPPAGAEVD